MRWIETKVTFQSDDVALAEDLIAAIFYDLEANGVVVDDPHLDPAEGWGPDAVPLPAAPAVTGYLPADQRLEQCRITLEAGLARLARTMDITYAISTRPVDEEDWAEAWKAFFWPEAITPNIVVKPTWRAHVARDDQMVIEIDPGMAFGTGTHPTTALCMTFIEKHLRPGQCVLDIGTGSGILLVAAAKLGAAALAGIDLDPLAVSVAAQNLALNNIPPHRYTLQCANLVEAESQAYDVVVANILADVILDLLDDVDRVITPNGIFICSGVIEARQMQVAQKMARCGFYIIDSETRGDWVALVGKRTNDQRCRR